MYPLSADVVAPLEVARWRPFVHWLLAIPQLLLANVLQQVGQVLAIISFFSILFTRRIPEGIFRFQAMQLRYNWRAVSYLMFLREPYPPFTFEMQGEDPGDDAGLLSVAQPDELHRWQPLIKWLLLIPHFFVLIFLVIAQFFAVLIGAFAIWFTGAWPEGLRRFVVGVDRWGFRVSGYFFLLYDEYPPFSLD